VHSDGAPRVLKPNVGYLVRRLLEREAPSPALFEVIVMKHPVHLVAPLALLIACASDAPAGAPLVSDAYFTGVPAQYASVEDCLAHSSHPYGWDCAFELALCHTGSAGLRTGDVITLGRYRVDTGLALGTIEGTSFTLDLETTTADGLGDGLVWRADVQRRWMTLQWDVTDCDLPP
jgi:hypothetical protein